MKPGIGLSDTNRNGVLKLLAPLLADEYVLLVKTRNYHWNVVGPQFNDLHKFFEAQYEELDDFVDDVAERMRQLGGKSPGTLAEFMRAARLKERPGQRPNARGMLAALPTTKRSSRRFAQTSRPPWRSWAMPAPATSSPA